MSTSWLARISSDLDKGAFLDHTNSCNGGYWGGLYNPDDYSACRIDTSLEEFYDQ